MSAKNNRNKRGPFARLHQLKQAGWLLANKKEPDAGNDVGPDSRRSDTGRRKPDSKDKSSYLVDETWKMGLSRREIEQERQRKYGRVNVRDHSDEDKAIPEGDLQNDIKNHPWLDSQRFDGIDPNVSPVPPLNSEARREYDNALRLQHQLRLEKNLENTPQPSTAPRPQQG